MLTFAAPVRDTPELARILALPRRPRPSLEEQRAMAAAMTERLRLHRTTPCACATLSREPCITQLLPIQGWYLTEAQHTGGALGHLVVGAGKTGIDILLAMVVPGVRRAVLMIPPALRKQFALDYQRWAQHFQVPNLAGGAEFVPGRPSLTVLAYSELSSAGFAVWLKAHEPDLIVADEAQSLKDRKATRTARFLRYFLESTKPVKLAAHSGTLTTRGLDDYAHLAALSLGQGSPLPLQRSVLDSWAGVLNPAPRSGIVPPAGELEQLCAADESPREGFQRRLLETPGVISTGDAVLPIPLSVHERRAPAMPEHVRGALSFVRKQRARPDGEELPELAEQMACARQLAAGFFYRWVYPRGESEALIAEWFARRQYWHRELREKLEAAHGPGADHLDSPALCIAAAHRYRDGYRGPLPTWRAEHLARWEEIAPQVQPQTATTWLSDYLVQDAAAWARERPGLVWYTHGAFGRRLAQASGLPRYGQSGSQVENLHPTPAMLMRRQQLIAAGAWTGDTCDSWLQTEDGSRSVVLSLRAHGAGKNLQAFSRMLFSGLPSDGGIWEQAIGRCHRQHQARPVEVWHYAHTPELRRALADAMRYCQYAQQTTGETKKLLSATYFDADGRETAAPGLELDERQETTPVGAAAPAGAGLAGAQPASQRETNYAPSDGAGAKPASQGSVVSRWKNTQLAGTL